MSFLISVKYYLKALKHDIKPASVSVTSDMWEPITLNVMHAWNKVLNRSGWIHWYNVTVCPWATPSLGKLLPWRQPGCWHYGSCWPYRQVRGGTLEGEGGQRGAVMCCSVCVYERRPEGGLGQCDWRGVGRTSAWQQGDQGAGDLPQLGMKTQNVDVKVSLAVYTLHTDTPTHLCMHTFTNTHTHTHCLCFECWPCWADRVSRSNTSLWQHHLFA